MVWALVRPGLGDFFPPGDLIGWDEAIEAYYKTEMPEEDKIAMGIEKNLIYTPFTQKFSKDMGKLAPQELPNEFRTHKTERNLASFVKLGFQAVDEELKTIIERLEPGVHQFWPMKVSMPNGQEYPKKYYGIVIHRHLKSFLPEKSDRESWMGGEFYPGKIGYNTRADSKATYAGIALSKDIIGSAHLWREKELTDPNVFISDELQAEIKKADLRIPRHYKVKVV